MAIDTLDSPHEQATGVQPEVVGCMVGDPGLLVAAALLIVFMLVALFKRPIDGLIERTNKLGLKASGVDFSLEAGPARNEPQQLAPEAAIARPEPLKPNEGTDPELGLDQVDADTSFLIQIREHLIAGRDQEAERCFTEVLRQAAPSEHSSLLFYFNWQKAFHSANNRALEYLRESVDSTESESERFTRVSLLSFVFEARKLMEERIVLWEKAAAWAESPSYITEAAIGLAYARDAIGESIEARATLVRRLQEAQVSDHPRLFRALGKIEESLGNEVVSVYCKDRWLKAFPEDASGHFAVSYMAYAKGVEDLALSNYSRCLALGPDHEKHELALNNFGVALRTRIPSLACKYFELAIQKGNALAMANKGYLLLSAGCLDDAERLAEAAMKSADPPKLALELRESIRCKREQDEINWKALEAESYRRKQSTRTYVERHYLGTSDELEGHWRLVDDNVVAVATVDGASVAMSWAQKHGTTAFEVHVVGKVSGASFVGTYRRRPIERDGVTAAIYGSGSKFDCIGFVPEGSTELTILSRRLDDDLFLQFRRAE